MWSMLPCHAAKSASLSPTASGRSRHHPPSSSSGTTKSSSTNAMRHGTCDHHAMSELVLADATEADRSRLLEIFTDVVERGDGYPESAPLQPDRFAASWVDPPVVVVARLAREVVGAYYLKPNFPGRAAHIANAGYVVARGPAAPVSVDDSSRTRSSGPPLRASTPMFTLVFESNPARPLYKGLGWRAVGRVPRAVDNEPAVIYWRD